MDYTMSNEDLFSFVSKDSLMHKETKGIFPIDKIPIVVKPHKMLFINTDPASLPGKHWVCVFIPDNGPPEFFDSLGRSPLYYSKNLLRVLGHRFVHNTIRLQSYNSSTCGLFCLFYLYHRVRNINFMEILSAFSNNLEQNEDVVIDFYRSFE
jgi:hypothetical protein